ncbi:hypothetical protein MASR1M65_15490 [Saprospiraceae bacterium]
MESNGLVTMTDLTMEETTGLDNPLRQPAGGSTDPKNPDTDGDELQMATSVLQMDLVIRLTDANNP